MSSKFCENCGAPMEDSAKFCNSCGKQVTVASAQPAPPPAAVNAPAAAPVQPAYTSAPSYPNPAPNPTQPTAYRAPNQPYSMPPQNPVYYHTQQPLQTQDTSPMSVGQYILTMIVMSIPLVGFIMMLIWSFSKNVNINKKNYCRAMLIMAVIGTVLGIIFAGVIVSIISSMRQSMGSGYGGYSYYGY